MIYTVTFNPSIDYVVHIDEINIGLTNRSKSEEYTFGGKGLNVSAVLSALGYESVALGFISGFTGRALANKAEEAGVKTDFIALDNGISRINIKIKSKEETEINCTGPEIKEKDLEKLLDKLRRLCAGDTLVLAGSIPKTLPEDIYETILKELSDRNIRFVVDATGNLLVNVLKYKPFLIKPNNYELAEIFGTEISKTDDEKIIHFARELQKQGAKNVIVSLAERGSILVDENGRTHKMGAAPVKAVNSVGAGDSMVAGFLAGYLQKGDYAYALRLGTACGGATAASEGLATMEKVQQLLSII